MIEAIDVLRLFGGFVYLILGGDLLVRGALALSRRTSVSPWIIGLTVVALGTSAPELVLSVYATATGFTGVALGNVVGSNIANVLLVLGVPALISPIVADSGDVKRQAAFVVAITIVFIVMMQGGVVSRLDGALLLGGLIAAFAYFIRRGVTVPGAGSPDEAEQFERVLGIPNYVRFAVLFLLLGTLLLPLGANLTVEGATAIARRLNISDVVIGSTVIAIGTSLPELTTTVIAAYHRSSDIALGNVIGSNLFNILLVAGASAVVAPLPVPAAFRAFDIWVMLAAAVAMFALVALKRPIGRGTGLVFVSGYLAYLGYLGYSV